MKVIDLNGREYHWQLAGHVAKRHQVSSLHIQARYIIKEVFPNVHILEEVPIRIYGNKTLYLDFYLPMYKKCIEVHGQQHYEFNKHFYESTMAFKRAQLNDQLKQEWCDCNGITYIVFPWDRTEEWKQILKS